MTSARNASHLPEVQATIDFRNVETDGQDYEVEEILAKNVVTGTTFYLIKWKGFDDNWNSWEPVSNMECPDKVMEFERKLEELECQSQTLQSSAKKNKMKKGPSRSRPLKASVVQSKTSKTPLVKDKKPNVHPQSPAENTASNHKSNDEKGTEEQRSSKKISNSATIASEDLSEEVEVCEIAQDPKSRDLVAKLKFKRDDNPEGYIKYEWYGEAKKKYPIAFINFYERNAKFKGVSGDALRCAELLPSNQ